MTSKLRIRIGEVEIDYEGTEEFLKQELPQLLKTAMELHKASGGSSEPGRTTSGSASAHRGAAPKKLTLTTASIAGQFGGASGAELLQAAAAHLVLVKGSETFSRQELLAEMKSAPAFYKSSYSGNLSNYIATAIQKDGPLAETGKDTYTLKAAARKTLEAKLADS